MTRAEALQILSERDRIGANIINANDAETTKYNSDSVEALNMAIAALKAEPCEAVSRQAVLDVLMPYCADDDGSVENTDDLRNALDDIESLPPVQPNPTECEDAVSREAVINAFPDILIVGYNHTGIAEYNHACIVKIVKSLPSVTPKQKWIPVSERLPEKTGLYLVSIGDLVTTGSFDGHNFRTQTMVRFVPDAWMPLPEPYKEGESE